MRLSYLSRSQIYFSLSFAFFFSTDADLGFPRSQVKRTFSVNPFPVWHVPANILEVETKNIAERQEKTTKNYSWLVEFDC